METFLAPPSAAILIRSLRGFSYTLETALADVIGLVRCRKLGASFASQLPKELRPDYRKIARAIAAEKS